MSLIVPTTLSPGYLALVYTNTSHLHKTTMRLSWGVDMEDVGALRIVASRWAEAVAGVLTNENQVRGFELQDPAHVRLYEEAFGEPFDGTHSGDDGENTGAYSRTLAVTGRGVGDSVFNQTGQWLGRIFVGRSYVWPSGVKFVPSDLDAATEALWTFYNECLVGPADFYGQHVEVRTSLPVQYNAFAQNHWGM